MSWVKQHKVHFLVEKRTAACKRHCWKGTEILEDFLNFVKITNSGKLSVNSEACKICYGKIPENLKAASRIGIL